MIDPGQGASFEVGADILQVILNHHIHAIGIMAGNSHIYNLVKGFQFPGISGCGQFVSNQGQGLGRSYLGGMHRKGSQHKNFPFFSHFFERSGSK